VRRAVVVVDLVEVLLRRRWRCGGVQRAVRRRRGFFLKQKKIFPEWIRKLSRKGKDTETAQTP
jgi:hypothetical protein